ncbi:MAG: hypothetical protein J5734_03295 [Prevotella sp.]|nr:hypothetical protein [Prevotella sp.]
MKTMNIHQHSCCRLAVFSILLALAPSTFAQKNIEAAFNSFKKDKAVSATESRSRENDPATGKLIQRTEQVDFRLAVKKQNLIDNLRAAFDADRDASYDEFTHTGNGHSQRPILLGKEISVGVAPNRNYIVMAFADKQNSADDPENRTAYALEWGKPDNSDSISGSLYIVYGPIPQKNSISVIRTIKGTTPEAISRYREKMRDFDWSGLKSSLDIDLSEIGQSLGDVGSALADLRLGEFGILADSLAASSGQATLQPWLYFFRMQTRGYRKAAKQGKDVTYNLTSLLEHCKKENGVLTADERRLCIDELRRLLDITKDDFDRALLGQCVKQLEKY